MQILNYKLKTHHSNQQSANLQAPNFTLQVTALQTNLSPLAIRFRLRISNVLIHHELYLIYQSLFAESVLMVLESE